MYFNDYELDILNRHRIDDLRGLAQATRRADSRPRIRIALAHGLVALANLIWQDERGAAEPAAPQGKAALA